jgi:hypothetical protein
MADSGAVCMLLIVQTRTVSPVLTSHHAIGWGCTSQAWLGCAVHESAFVTDVPRCVHESAFVTDVPRCVHESAFLTAVPRCAICTHWKRLRAGRDLLEHAGTCLK